MIRAIISLLKYILKTSRTYWFTATSKTKARYARTSLGSFWLGISTLLTVVCLGSVYGTIFKVSNFRDYFIYLGFGLVIWTPISEAINQAPLIFSNNSNSLKNSRIKPIFFVCQEWAFQVQSFVQAFLMVLLVFLILSPNLFWNLGFSILHFLNLFLFLFWLQLLISLLGTKFTDLFQLLPVLTNLIFLLSPILYQKVNLGSYSIIADLNPIYQILRLLRSSLINGTLNLELSLMALVANLFFIICSLMVYVKMEKRLIFYL
jgi:lipopolysaccharide transport system permease protein